LQPILDVLNLLVAHYGVTVVLCTATQPALNSTTYFDPDKNLRGLENVREIIDNPDALFDALKRVHVELPPDWTTPTPWADIAAQLSAEDCVLGIVNTRKAARELQRAGADALLMDCIGYTDRHRAAAARATGLPVMLSSDLVARVTGACLYEAP